MGARSQNHNEVPVELLAALRAEQLFMRRLPSLPPPGFAQPPLDRSLSELDRRSSTGGGPLATASRRVCPDTGRRHAGWTRDRPAGGSSYWRILTKFGPTMAPIAASVLGVGIGVDRVRLYSALRVAASRRSKRLPSGWVLAIWTRALLILDAMRSRHLRARSTTWPNS
jgi:hypothetical protein